MAGVGGERARFAEFLVALQTRGVAAGAGGKHVVGLAVMAGVAGDAGEFSTFVTGRFDEAVVLAAADADHAIRPKEIAEEIGVFGEVLGEAGNGVRGGSADDGSGFLEVVSRAVFETGVAPVAGFIDPFHGMAEAADLGGAFGGEFFGVDDFAGLEGGGRKIKIKIKIRIKSF